MPSKNYCRTLVGDREKLLMPEHTLSKTEVDEFTSTKLGNTNLRHADGAGVGGPEGGRADQARKAADGGAGADVAGAGAKQTAGDVERDELRKRVNVEDAAWRSVLIGKYRTEAVARMTSIRKASGWTTAGSWKGNLGRDDRGVIITIFPC